MPFHIFLDMRILDQIDIFPFYCDNKEKGVLIMTRHSYRLNH